jgi:ABC-type multidrug transport system fused ATPase/permease subunit
MRRLLLNGLGQVGAAFAIAWLVRHALEGLRMGGASWPLMAGLFASGGAILGLRVLERVDAERLGQDYVMKVRLRIFDQIAAMPSRTEHAERFGLTMTRLVNDLNALKNWVSTGVARMAVASVSLVGTLGVLTWFDPLAAAIAGVIVLLCVGLGLGLTPILRGHVRESRRRRGRLAGNLGEKVLAADTVQHFGRTERERRALRVQSRRLVDALVRRMRVSGILRSLPDAALPLAVAGLIGLVSWDVAANRVAGGDLVVTLLLLGMIMASLRDVALAWDYRLSYEEGRRRIESILAAPRVRESRRAVDLEGTGPLALEFRDVHVVGVLEGISVRAEAGERVLVTGATGSGKSTLVALAARLFDPDQGRILLAGRRLRRLSLVSLHRAVQLVSPVLPLLRGSVAENLAYGLGEGDAERVETAAALCGLEESTLLPQGMATRIRERGQNLPDGLRARIALARAIAASPRLLLIDDAAFSVDAEARAALRRVLAVTEATVLFVAPEGSEIPAADRIWQLEDRRVQESRPIREPAAEHSRAALKIVT